MTNNSVGTSLFSSVIGSREDAQLLQLPPQHPTPIDLIVSRGRLIGKEIIYFVHPLSLVIIFYLYDFNFFNLSKYLSLYLAPPSLYILSHHLPT